MSDNDIKDVLSALLGTMSKISEKLDKITPTEESKPKAKRGRPKGSKNTPKPKPQPTPEPVPHPVEDDDEDDDDDPGVFHNDKRMARSSGIQIGKRINKWNPNDYVVPAPPEDKKAMRLASSGKLPRTTRRGPAKMVSIRCNGCGKKFKQFKDSIIKEENWKCNGCSQGGA